MNIEEFREYCISVKGASESFPFDESTLVFKVMEKMFAYISLEPKDGQFNVNLKCNPEKSIELREKYQGVRQGIHTRSIMWNSVYLANDVPDSLIKELIAHSVEEVIKKLPKKKQEEYRKLLS
ncbi:MAG: MmcQ/YjbR family DNA-binding protein [Prevotellaceae bacterium]|jgi:predicted DNA-binding protein (MmcQ/YjbR family)|nr:MmcQ/YjbR family DNA-binding protein [Prevotellaceae bacterium]